MQNRQVRIPIRVTRQVPAERERPEGSLLVEEASPPVVEAEETAAPASAEARPSPEPAPSTQEDDLAMWRDRALRLEAEMDNYRKRQRRLSEEQTAANKGELLRSFLTIADDLSRALSADDADAESLREGVRLTAHNLNRLLDQEGVKPLPAKGRTFDPAWHEAVGSVAHEQAGVEPGTVVEVVRPGYRLGERLLRPPRVIVAQ